MPRATCSTLARMFIFEALIVFVLLNAYILYINTAAGSGARAAEEFLERDRVLRSERSGRRAVNPEECITI